MNAKDINEAPIGQMQRLFSEHLGPGLQPKLDSDRYIRLGMIENCVKTLPTRLLNGGIKINTDNFIELSDYAGYRRRFRNLFGFEVEGVDYDEAVETEINF